MAVASVVRRNCARTHRAVAGSPMSPSSAVPNASALTRYSTGFHRRAAAITGTMRAASSSVRDPRTPRAVEHSTRPETSGACRRYSS